jgi:hypothetical protein
MVMAQLFKIWMASGVRSEAASTATRDVPLFGARIALHSVDWQARALGQGLDRRLFPTR